MTSVAVGHCNSSRSPISPPETVNEELSSLSKGFPWGKYNKEIGIHRLEHHCADVAACFEVLVRSPVLRNRFQCAAGDCPITEVTLARLTVIVFLHDVGKINSGFQFKPFADRKGSCSRQFGHLLEAVYGIQRQDVCDSLGLVGMLESWGPALEPLILASLSHHGRPVTFPNQTGTGPSEIWKPRVGYDYDPIAAAKMLRSCVDRWLPDAFQEGPQLPTSHAFHHLFAGVVALADQIGSNTEFSSLPARPIRTTWIGLGNSQREQWSNCGFGAPVGPHKG